MQTKQPIHFYDAATPENVPSGVHAAIYVNGRDAWPRSQVDRMAAVFRISVLREASWAKFARCLDIEPGAAEPQDAVPFMGLRLELGFPDGTTYVNRSNRAEVQELCREAKLKFRGKPWMPFEWVATLDGTDVSDAWAVQLETVHGYDYSVLHGINNFHKS